MYLKQHAGRELALRELIVQPDHGDLDDVRGRALDRHVDRDALGAHAHVEVPAVNVRDVPTPTSQRLRVAVCARLVDDVVTPAPHGVVLLEVALDEGAGLFAADAL